MDNPTIAGYEILRQLGRGGMAIVYLAVQQSFDRQVALKVMSHTLLSDPSFGERFLREARIVAQLSNRNIIQVYDVGAQGDNHYIAMEYMQGGDLKGKLRDGIPLSEGIVIIKEIATALDFAAAKGYVHRDIKPENILFREDGSSVLSDFGIARSTNSATQMTLAGTVIGTPLYMSPEQAQALDLDGRSDLYSLGTIFFEMLTGHVPYDADSAISISIKHVTDPIPRLHEDLTEFQPFIDTALAKKPDDRFQTGAELKIALDELEDALQNAATATRVISRKPLARGATTGPRSGKSSASSLQTQRIFSRTGAGTHPGTGSKWFNLLPHPARWSAAILAVAFAGVVGWYLVSPELANQATSIKSTEQVPRRFDATIAIMLKNADAALQDNKLYSPPEDNAVYYYTTVLALAPDTPEAMQGIELVINELLIGAEQLIKNNQVGEAKTLLARVADITFYTNDSTLHDRQRDLRSQLITINQQEIRQEERKRELVRLITAAENALELDKLTSPIGDNAYERFQSALALDPDNLRARQGIASIAEKFLGKAKNSAGEQNFARARALMAAAVQIDSEHVGIASIQVIIETAENAYAAELTNTVDQAQNDQSRRVQYKRDQAQKAAIIIQTLGAAKQDVENNRLSSPPGQNAVEKYRDVLDLDPSNIDALEGLQLVGAQYIGLARTMLENNNLAQADIYMRQAQSLSPNNPQLRLIQRALLNAKDQLELARVAREKQAEEDKAVTDKKLKTEQSITEVLRRQEQAAQARRKDEASKSAALKRIGTSTGKVNTLRSNVVQAIAARQYNLAKDNFSKLMALAPAYPNATALRAQLESAELRTQQSNAILNEAKELIDTEYRKPGIFGSNRSTRGALKSSYTIIKAAGGIDPGNPRVHQSLIDLEDKYATIISMHADNKDYDRAKDFLDDSHAMKLPAGKIIALAKKVADRKFKSSRPTGIF